ncbi:MAG: hypothetical protein A3B44_00100 [Candidatus Levybacteria bacterium RIFCSPLOWO2_01_FULL_38_21]|nr:MAG: hypothetical protein A3B44_00100 [Candidatus Levybacteria bacterium RIFCSPLOWO2_01_FULL_38_21]
MIFNRRSRLARKGRGAVKVLVSLNKRERFIFSVVILSIGLFVAEHLLGKSGIFMIFTMAFLTGLLLFLSLYYDLKENSSPQIFILPFFFSLSFGLFYFLVPARYLTRIFTTALYGVGLYSLFLSENIFIVSSIRTIALLQSARTVAFVITLISYFFLTNVLFSLHIQFVPFLIFLFLFSFPLIVHSIWTYTLEKNLFQNIYWPLILALLLLETASILWFWPSTPTVLAIFLTGVFYTIVGLYQVWLEKRLFKSVMWEYIWVSSIVLITLLLFTSWSG